MHPKSKPLSSPVVVWSIVCLGMLQTPKISAAQTNQMMSSINGTTQTPGWNNANKDIANSQASAKSKQDAYAVLAALSNFQNNHTPIPLKESEVIYNSDIGLAHGDISIYSYWEMVGPGGVFLSAPIGGSGSDNPSLSANATQKSEALNSGVPQGIDGLAGGIGATRVLCQVISFTVTWADPSPPTVTIAPAVSQAISIGDSLTFMATAIHFENELIKHNLEWKLPPPSEQWGKNIPGYNGVATIHPSGIISESPDMLFPATTTNTRTITFTPLMQGRYVFRFAAADKVAGFGYSPEIAVMVENTAPVQSVSIPSAVYVGDPAYALTHTASNPTTLGDFLTGIRIFEQREDLSGNIYQPWLELYYQTPVAGNRVYTTTRPSPDRPGVIRYRAHAWNQWMNDTDNVHEYTIQIPNRAPTITWENPPASVEYGQPLVIRARAQDADNNLAAIHMDMNGNPHRHDGFTAGLTGNTSNAYLDSYPAAPDAGNYTYTAVALDGWAVSESISHTVTVTKATPKGTFDNQSITEGMALTSGHLSAHFSNNGVTAPPTTPIVYTILSGGNASHPDGTIITAGMVLPSGVYMIRATFASTPNYNGATADAQFRVEANPNADNDGDGLSNAIETALGLDPNSPAIESPASLDVNIHTPTIENQ